MKRRPRAPGTCQVRAGETPKAIQPASTAVTSTAATRAASGRTSAGIKASSATRSGRYARSSGSSIRSHVVAMTAAGTIETRSVLRNTRLRRGEHAREIVTVPHDGDRNADRLEPQELRLGRRVGLHVDERGPSARQR